MDNPHVKRMRNLGKKWMRFFDKLIYKLLLLYISSAHGILQAERYISGNPQDPLAPSVACHYVWKLWKYSWQNRKNNGMSKTYMFR